MSEEQVRQEIVEIFEAEENTVVIPAAVQQQE
jgi:hypothetical protein